MLLEKMGYMISELFMLLVVLILVFVLLRLRRGRNQDLRLTEANRNLFFRPIKINARAPERMLRYALIAATALPIHPNRKNLMRRVVLPSGEKAAKANTVMSAKNGARKSATMSTACPPPCMLCFRSKWHRSKSGHVLTGLLHGDS